MTQAGPDWALAAAHQRNRYSQTLGTGQGPRKPRDILKGHMSRAWSADRRHHTGDKGCAGEGHVGGMVGGCCPMQRQIKYINKQPLKEKWVI